MVLSFFWLGVLSSLLAKWPGPSLLDAITCTTSPSTEDSRNATTKSPSTALLLSVSPSVMSSLSASAVPSPRLSASTFSAKRSSMSKVTSGKSSFSSEQTPLDEGGSPSNLSWDNESRQTGTCEQAWRFLHGIELRVRRRHETSIESCVRQSAFSNFYRLSTQELWHSHCKLFPWSSIKQ